MSWALYPSRVRSNEVLDRTTFGDLGRFDLNCPQAIELQNRDPGSGGLVLQPLDPRQVSLGNRLRRDATEKRGDFREVSYGAELKHNRAACVPDRVKGDLEPKLISWSSIKRNNAGVVVRVL